jgi:hypothetical protein
MRRIFIDDEQQQLFDRQGYIILPHATAGLMQEMVNEMLALKTEGVTFEAFQENPHHKHDMHSTFWDLDKNYRTQTFGIITAFFKSALQKYLVDYKFIQANVFIKYANSGYIAPHQNLTILDESRFTSLSFWCPSIDTNKQNGTMYIVPGSHKKFVKYRTTNFGWPLMPVFEDYTTPLFEPVNVNAGDLLIIDDSLIHGTIINSSSQTRWVFHALVAPIEAELFVCDVNAQENNVYIYNAPEMFFQYYMPGIPSNHLELREIVPYTEEFLTEQEIRARINARG